MLAKLTRVCHRDNNSMSFPNVHLKLFFFGTRTINMFVSKKKSQTNTSTNNFPENANLFIGISVCMGIF